MQLHEDYNRREKLEGSSDRGFGLVFTTLFVIVALLPLRAGRPVRLWALPIAGMFLLLALLSPRSLHALNRLWMQLALVLSRVFNPIVTGLLFYLVVTPFGTMMRVLGKDPMRLRFEPSAPTYWLDRHPPGPMPASMSDQF